MRCVITLYPYFAMILAATPSPGMDPGPLSANGEVSDAIDGGEPDDDEGFEVSVREGGGAIAAPPVEAVEKQSH